MNKGSQFHDITIVSYAIGAMNRTVMFEPIEEAFFGTITAHVGLLSHFLSLTIKENTEIFLGSGIRKGLRNYNVAYKFFS